MVIPELEKFLAKRPGHAHVFKSSDLQVGFWAELVAIWVSALFNEELKRKVEVRALEDGQVIDYEGICRETLLDLIEKRPTQEKFRQVAMASLEVLRREGPPG